MKRRVPFASPLVTMIVPPEPEPQGFTSNPPSQGRPIPHYPIPDFSKVKPRTNSYNTPDKGSENREVSGVVACCVVQIEGSNPNGMGWKF
jgi:hypothetical protein